jgi:hypothetical protein
LVYGLRIEGETKDFCKKQQKTVNGRFELNMAYAEDILDQLFPSELSPNEPILHEPLRRSRNERIDYRQWKRFRGYRAMSRLFKEACWLKKMGIRCSVNVHLFQSQAANAFSISCSEFIDPKNFQHYFDFLRERVLSIGYQPHRSEREFLDRVLYVETVERHSFKIPDEENDQGKLVQLYGHIYLELIRVNDRPSYLRLMVTKVGDTRFAPPRSFEELMGRVMM